MSSSKTEQRHTQIRLFIHGAVCSLLVCLATLLASCHPSVHANQGPLESRDVGCLSFWTPGARLDSLLEKLTLPPSIDSLPRFSIRPSDSSTIPVSPGGIYVHPGIADTFAIVFLEHEGRRPMGAIVQRCHLEGPIFIVDDSIAHIVAPGDYTILAAHDNVVVARSRYHLLSP